MVIEVAVRTGTSIDYAEFSAGFQLIIVDALEAISVRFEGLAFSGPAVPVWT